MTYHEPYDLSTKALHLASWDLLAVNSATAGGDSSTRKPPLRASRMSFLS